MKRFRLKLMTALTLIFVLLTTVGFAAETTTYNAAKEFQTKGQGPVWFYQYNNGSGFKNSPNYYADWNSWSLVADPSKNGPYSNISTQKEGTVIDFHPEFDTQGKKVTLAVMWKAPADGKVTIPKTTLNHHDWSGSKAEDMDKTSLNAAILHNSKKLWTGSIEGANGTTNTKELVINVKKGDEIRFAGDAGDRGGYNNIEWPVTLTFEEGEVAEAPSNPQTGDAGLATYGFLAALAVAGMALVVRRK